MIVANLDVKTVLPDTLPCTIFINFRLVATAQLIMVKLRDDFLYERWRIWKLPYLYRNRLKVPANLSLWTMFY